MHHARFIIFLTITLFYSIQSYGSTDFALIQQQGQLANDTYLPPTELEAALKLQDQVLIHQNIMPGSNVSYFLSRSQGAQTLSIRGTANLENALVDLNLSLRDDKTLNIKLHQGFASAAIAVYNDVQPFLDLNEPIYITGHSLGGAIAVILGMYLSLEDAQISQIVTFGQPKVTNVTGANEFSQLPLIRVVNQSDIVPLVPPISPMQIKDLDIFWHMGSEIILNGSNEFSITSGIKSALRATKFTTSIPNQANLIAHKMDTYLTHISQLRKGAVEVPYKMGIDLFGVSID